MAVLSKVVGTTKTPFPTPKSITWTEQTLDSEGTGRNQAGDMFRDVIAKKIKLSVEWGITNATDMATILSLIDDVFFTIEYPSAKTGDMETMECYVGDRSTPTFKLYQNDWAWNGITISFIER